jgi:RNA polymerase sigma-70 factor, ECF subfamily
MKIVSSNISERIKSGDVSAFHELFEAFHPDLCRFALQYVKDEDIAKDIVQDFFVHFWIQRENLKINTSISSYLYSSIRNRSLNYLRNNRKFYKLDSGEDIPDNSNNFFEFTHGTGMDDLNKKISEAIDELPPKCQAVYKLSRTEKLSYKEIAEKLDISIKTVETQMGIAFKKLREKLKPLLKILPVVILLLKLFFKQI